MFADGIGFAAQIAPYPRMRGKAAMLMALYRGLDSRLADIFARTGLTAAASNG